MKCKDFEQGIYLYRELSETERNQIDAHTQECAACKELFQLVASASTLVAEVSLVKPEIVNHGRLTSNIMQVIQTESNSVGVFTKFIEEVFVRYAFVAASFGFLILFLAEQQEIKTLSQIHKQMPQSKSVTLNTSALLEDVIKRSETKKSENPVSLYACVKSGDCPNPLSKNLN